MPWATLGPAACFLLKPEQVLLWLAVHFSSLAVSESLCWPSSPLGVCKTPVDGQLVPTQGSKPVVPGRGMWTPWGGCEAPGAGQMYEQDRWQWNAWSRSPGQMCMWDGGDCRLPHA